MINFQKIVNGNSIAKQILQSVKQHIQVTQLRPPKLSIILVGDSTASASYVKRKMKVCQDIGITSELFHFNEFINQFKVIEMITKLNHDTNVDGILVQLPLPLHLDRNEIIHTVQKEKDADCLHLHNLQKIMINGELNEMLPCTPAGVLAILDHHNINVKGLATTIIGRSLLVGFPLGLLLMKRNATITVCHRFTQDLKQIIEKSDLVISAAGSRHLVKGDWIKKGAIVIDVGINKAENQDKHKIVGDVEFDKALENASLITPVPGGVGPMTIAMLMRNVHNIWCKRNGLPVYINPNLGKDYLIL